MTAAPRANFTSSGDQGPAAYADRCTWTTPNSIQQH